MTNEEIKAKLDDFLTKKHTPPYGNPLELCKQCGFRRFSKRRKTRWGKRNLEKENHWENIDLNNYSTDKPMVVCLSGNGTNTDAEANGFCKRVGTSLELLLKKSTPIENVELLGCAYGEDKRYLYCPDEEDFYKTYPNLNDYAREFPKAVSISSKSNDLDERDVNQFTNAILMPRCLDKDGNALPTETCCKNISQITFFTYCYGAKALNEIIKSFKENLKSHDFTDESINQILNSMMHVSFARKDYVRTIPSVYFYAANDYDIGSIIKIHKEMEANNIKLKTRLSKCGDLAFGQEYAPDRFGNVAEKDALEFTYLTGEPNPDFVYHDPEHYFSNLDRDLDWDILRKSSPIYDAISQMVAWSLCRSVENSLKNAKSKNYIPKMPLSDLQTELISIYKNFETKNVNTK